MTDFAWTDDAVAKLRELWATGRSASQIAEIMGCARNAVIGKVHRLGLPGRGSPIRRRDPAAPPPREPKQRVAPALPGPTLLELTESSCRYPIGHPQEPRFHFCGKPRTYPFSYCQAHVRRCFMVSDHERAPPGEIAKMLGPIVDAPKVMTKAQRLARAAHAQRIYGGGQPS